MTGDLVLLYDGLCGLCNGTVRFILARDRVGTLKFAPLQGAFAAGVRARHPEIAGVDSLVLVEREQGAGSTERVFVRSEAALGLARYLGGVWLLAGIFRLVPRVLRDWAYDRVAASRYRLFGRLAVAVPAPADVRDRFLS